VLEDFVTWAERQFRQLGQGSDSRRFAVSLMAGVQGATVMAKAMRNSDIISDEINRLVHWMENMPNRKIQLGKVAVKPGDVFNAA
jgi:hypothetical protein